MVTPDQVAIALGRPQPAGPLRQQWQQWIDDGYLLVRTRLGDLSLLDQELLDYVVREAVTAMVRRPDDATQVEVAVDDGRVSRTYQTGSGRVTILDEWWELLAPATDQAFSIRPTFEPDPVVRFC